MPVPAIAVESIPDESRVSRAYFDIPVGIDEESYFPFPYDKELKERAESVIWSKYAPLTSDVHARGCAIEKIKNMRREAKGDRTTKYIGAREASVLKVRQIKTGRGLTLTVTHFPQPNGDDSHAHLSIVPVAGGNAQQLNKNDVRELVSLLVAEFGVLDKYDCSAGIG